MPTPPDPTGRPSSAKTAASAPSSDQRPAESPPDLPDLKDAIPPPAGSTGSHNPSLPLSDLIPKGKSGSSQRQSSESEIAQFLAHPQGGAANTDDAPTVITQNNKPGSTPPRPATVPLPVTGEAPSIAGRKLGHFELIGAIGAGGMAAVLKARDLELGRVVALKILPPEAARDPESVNRFKQEARAAAKLDHDNVARVYFCGEDQGLHFIAFEFVEGDNLRVLIERRGPLSAAECVPYMMQVAAGLNHAAERGVVHRDIKPSNILITPDGRAKIVDMGLARYLGSEAVNGGVTQSGVTLGTFDYISPEQALDPRRADVRSDIYSLGCTFYHALTGRPPVPEGTAARKLRAHQNDEPLDPRELNPAIPDELAAVLARMMAKDPAARYQSPTELIAHLKGLAERLHLGADPLAHDTATKSVPAELHLLPEVPRFRPWWVLAVAAVSLAVVAFVIATSNPGPAPGAPVAPGYQVKAPETPFDSARPPLPPAPGSVAASGPVRTPEELAARLADAKPGARVPVQLAPGEFDLTKLTHAVAFQGKELELVGAPIGMPGGVTKVTLAAAPPGRDAPGTLTVKAEGVTLRNIWFDLKLDPDVPDAPTPVCGLRLDEASRVTLEDCVFAASHEKLKSHEVRSVAVSRAAENVGTNVHAARCLFTPAAVGVTVPVGSHVTVSDCGFAPHTSAVMIEDSVPGVVPPEASVRLDHCTFMLNPGGCAVETGAPANARVVAADCVFAPVGGEASRPSISMPSEAVSEGVVIRVRGEKPDGVSLSAPSGRTNAYYHVEPLGTLKEIFTAEQCKSLSLKDVEDKGRVELKRRPWSEEIEPVATVTSDSPWKAFKLRVIGSDADGSLFTNDKKPVPLGVAFHNQPDNVRRAYADIPIPWGGFTRPKGAESRQKVWYPKVPEDERSPLVYKSLAALLEDVRPGDEILIRHDGELTCDGVELKTQTKPSDGEFRVTFRPYAGSKPTLVIRGGARKDQTLFKLVGGEVTFDGIHFKLRPDPKAEQTVAAVALLGGKSCTFNNCLFTLAEDDDSKVAAVHLPDIEPFMMMKPETRQTPKVAFEHCLVRGKGRGVWARVSRPVNLVMMESVTALDGPVFLSEAGGKANGAATSSAKFIRVTALAGGPVVEMRASKSGDPKAAGITPLKVDADECLFVAVDDAGKLLVKLDGVDPADWKMVLTWQVTKGNRYAGFDPTAELALIQPGGDGAPKVLTRDDWIGNMSEPAGAANRFGTVTFTAPAVGVKLNDLPAVKPADLVLKAFDFADLPGAKSLDAGADPAKLKELPLPVEEPKPD